MTKKQRRRARGIFAMPEGLTTRLYPEISLNLDSVNNKALDGIR